MVTNSDIPSALFSVYSTPQTNQPLLLHQGTVEIQMGSKKVAMGEGNICLNWLPSPGIKAEINNAILDIPVRDFEYKAFINKVQLLLVDSEVRASAYLNEVSYLPDANTEDFWRIDVAGNLDEAIWLKSDESLEYILGHLVNFPELAGDWVSHSQSNGMSRARAVLTTENWKITIDGVSNISELTKKLHQSGGYAITSLIKIERPLKSDSSILLDDIKKITEALYFFFSFAVGRYSPVVLPVGFDFSGTESWYEWQDWLIPQWEKTISWFSGRRSCDSLAQVFPGFMKIWNASESIWRESIQRSIVWYVESSRTTADPSGRIILVQSALELLSWTYFIVSKRKTEQEFKDLGDICKKIRVFLDELNIPTYFSDTSGDLQHLGRFIEINKQNWQQREAKFLKKKKKKCTNTNDDDYVEITAQSLKNYLYLKAFVEVRNDIVHPRQEYENSFWVRVEALNFGLWCLELSLLRLFEYQGSYTNRLKNGELEAVPWAEVINT